MPKQYVGAPSQPVLHAQAIRDVAEQINVGAPHVFEVIVDLFDHVPEAAVQVPLLLDTAQHFHGLPIVVIILILFSTEGFLQLPAPRGPSRDTGSVSLTIRNIVATLKSRYV